MRSQPTEDDVAFCEHCHREKEPDGLSLCGRCRKRRDDEDEDPEASFEALRRRPWGWS